MYVLLLFFFFVLYFFLLLYRLDQSFVNTSTAATVNRLLALWNRIRLNFLHWPHNLCRFWCDEATASAQLYTCVCICLCVCGSVYVCNGETQRNRFNDYPKHEVHSVYYTHDRKTTNAKWTKDEKSAAILLCFVRHTTFLYRFLTRASVRPMCTLTAARSRVFFPNIYSNGVK